MKKMKRIVVTLIILCLLINPFKVYAVTENTYYTISNLNIAACILGSVGDPNSVAWLLQKLLNYMRAIAPIIVVIMSGLDFSKVIMNGDDDNLKKSQKKLITRLLLLMALFLLPVLTDFLLDLFGFSNATCGIR